MNELNPTARLALTNFGFLVPRNTRMTTRQLAAAIRRGYDNLNAYAVADELEAITGIFTRAWGDAVIYGKMSDANKYEIAVRDAGWEVQKGPDPDSTMVRLVEIATGYADATYYASPEHAWEAGATIEIRGIDPDKTFYYGPLRAAASDRSFLESLGVKLSHHDSENGAFMAKLSLCALHAINAHHELYEFDRLNALPCEVKAKKDLLIDCIMVTMKDLKKANLVAYRDYLAFELSNAEHFPAVFSETWRVGVPGIPDKIDQLKREQAEVQDLLAALDARQSPSSESAQSVSHSL